MPKEAGADRANLQVILTVTDSQGGVGTDFLRIAHVGWEAEVGSNQPPVPVITQDNRGFKYNIIGQPISLSGQMSTDPNSDRIQCTWDFGDGFKGEGVTTAHTFTGSAPSYTVTLTATDNWGASATTSVVIPMAGWVTPCDDLILNAQLQKMVCVGQAFTAGPAGQITLPTASAASAGLPSSAASYYETTLTKLSGTYTAGGSTLTLNPTQTGTGAAISAIVSYDLTGDGTFDRVETYPAFALTNPATPYAGTPTATGAFGNMINGTVKLQVWVSTPGTGAVSLLAGTSQQGGLTSHVKIPFTNTQFYYNFGDYAVPSSAPTTTGSTNPTGTPTGSTTGTGSSANPTSTTGNSGTPITSNPTTPGSTQNSDQSRPSTTGEDPASCSTIADSATQAARPSDASVISLVSLMTLVIVLLML